MSTATWYEVATTQAGLITLAQLEQHGISSRRRLHLVDQRLLERRGRGLWGLPGWPDDWPRPLWEAALGAGPAAVVFRRSAAALWGMDGVPVGTVELALPPGHQSRVPGVHRVGSLTPSDLTRNGMLTVTTVLRTLADLGSAVPAPVVERAAEWALRNRILRLVELEGVAQRLSTSGGGRRLAEVLALRPAGAPPTESDAETLFVQLARRGGYPDPVRQYGVILRGRRYRLDFAWPQLRLAVEIDGAAVHGPDALPSDLRRQNQILLDGWLILRFTWGSLVRSGREVETDLRAAWALRGALVRAR